jgi:hypothetical protein
MRVAFSAAILAAVLTSHSNAAGFARNVNFMVYTPSESTRANDQRFAELVVARAEKFRNEIAREWLGEELPAGAGRTVIYVEFSQVEDRGLTWARDHRDRQFHNIWLTTSPRLAVSETLKHEIAHAVLATRYAHPNRLPSWLEEGIASRYDDEARRASREQLLRSWARTGRAANLALVLELDDLQSFDENSYAAATSLVSFLLTRGDAQTLLRFGEDGQRRGWAAALQSSYGVESLQALQSQWMAWLASDGGELDFAPRAAHNHRGDIARPAVGRY